MIRKLVVCLALLAVGCSQASRGEIDVDQVIAEKVAERLTAFRQVQQRQCLDRAEVEAGRLADSILLERARLTRDTFGRPLRPSRPDQPAWQDLRDSLPLRPLFDSVR